MDFKKKLKQYQELINEELSKYIETRKCPEEMLNRSMEYSLMARGKRLRPILVIATYQIFKKDALECIVKYWDQALEVMARYVTEINKNVK